MNLKKVQSYKLTTAITFNLFLSLFRESIFTKAALSVA